MTRLAAERSSDGLGRSAMAFAGYLLLLHGLAAVQARDPRVLMPHVVGWLHDCLIMALLAGVFGILSRLLPGSWSRVARAAGFGAIFAAAMVLALYPGLLQVFLASPVNIFATDAAAAGAFIRDYLGIRALWPAAVALAAGVLSRRVPSVRIRRRCLIAAVPVALFTALTLGHDSPNPVVFGLQDSLRQLWAPRAVPRLKTTIDGSAPPAAGLTVDWDAAARKARYDHVALIVLESVTASDFEAGFLLRPGGFFERRRQHARYFSRYYATNLDSYTALLAMTTSIQVPFRAYAAPERYAPVNGAPNMVRGLRDSGFRTLFASTYQHQPFVPNRRDWDKVMDRRDLGDLRRWTSLGSNRMEAATEDRAALPAIVEFMAAGPKSFVLAELVFGHSPEWRVKTGRTPVEYYDRYLTELWDRLTGAGLSSRTLLIIVSDHGERSRASDAENYRVPLLVVGDSVEQGTDGALRSHLDLQAILAHHLFGAAMPAERSAVTFVGSTERWIYGMLLATGEHAFIDDSTGRVLSGSLAPAFVRDTFQTQVSAFAAAFQHGPR